MLGAISGDIIGSVYEFQNCRSKNFPLFTDRSNFTDDTVCTVALSYALLHRVDPVEVLHAWRRRFPGRGYGGKFHKWIRNDHPTPYGSFGNGAAMRVSGAAWIANSLSEALFFSDKITEITHNHEEGIRGARAVAHSIYLGLQGELPISIRKIIETEYGYDLSQSVDSIRQTYRFDETCQGTVPQALTCALSGRDFEDAIRNAISIGGDSDTVSAIAGSVAEPLFGIPKHIARQVLRYLPEDFRTVISDIRRLSENSGFSGNEAYPQEVTVLRKAIMFDWGKKTLATDVLATMIGSTPYLFLNPSGELMEEIPWPEMGPKDHILTCPSTSIPPPHEMELARQVELGYQLVLDQTEILPLAWAGGGWKIQWLKEQGLAIETRNSYSIGNLRIPVMKITQEVARLLKLSD